MRAVRLANPKVSRFQNINNIDYSGDSALNVIGDNIIVTLGFVCMDWTRLFVSHRLNLCGWETHPERGFLIIFTITWIYIIAMTWYLYALICDSVLIMAANIIQPVRTSRAFSPPPLPAVPRLILRRRCSQGTIVCEGRGEAWALSNLSDAGSL